MTISTPRIVGELREWRYNSNISVYEGKLYGDFFKRVNDGTNINISSIDVKENVEYANMYILKLHDGRQFICYKDQELPEV